VSGGGSAADADKPVRPAPDDKAGWEHWAGRRDGAAAGGELEYGGLAEAERAGGEADGDGVGPEAAAAGAVRGARNRAAGVS
jgi:hypothetical protein